MIDLKAWQEECGVFGIFDCSLQQTNAAKQTYFGLFALQHRGQESAGIAINRQGKIFCQKDQGLVVDIFDDTALLSLVGHSAIGHVRYPSAQETTFNAIQPIQIKAKFGQLALSHNGAIINSQSIRHSLSQKGKVFQTAADFEVILSLLNHHRLESESMEEAILLMMSELKGAYAMVLMTADSLIGIRDPLGIRPLILGKLGTSYVLASESCALDAIGAEIVRDVLPGEIITISSQGMQSEYYQPNPDVKAGRLCIFEFVYFARPDSYMDGASVQESRIEAGKLLASESPCEADLVVGTPDSGIASAMGYAQEMNIPYGAALLKNRYVARTIAKPSQLQQELFVRLKFSVLKEAVRGKKIVLVDDSIVRGTTTSYIIQLLKNAGALEVHLRVASPPIKFPCYYGIYTPAQSELHANQWNLDDLCQQLGADSLHFLSLFSLTQSTKNIRLGHCTACFNGDFPAGQNTMTEEKLHQIIW